MSNVPSPIEVTNWPQVAALALLLAAFVILPAVINYLMNRPVKRTLTTNNGGSTMKDVIERIDKRLAEIEGAATTEEYDDAPNP